MKTKEKKVVRSRKSNLTGRIGQFATLDELAQAKTDRLMKLLEGVDLTELFDEKKTEKKE